MEIRSGSSKLLDLASGNTPTFDATAEFSTSATTEVTQIILDSLNEHELVTNKDNLNGLGGLESLAKQLGVSLDRGLTTYQVAAMKEKFGSNVFPEAPFDSYLELLIGALGDTTLQILLVAAAVSFGIGYWQDPEAGWIDGAAIFIAVFLVSNISAGNDYSKQLQFLALEKASQKDERTSVLRNGTIERINPTDIVVGDIIILQVNELNIYAYGCALNFRIGWRLHSC
jgi:Ca2+-transporting ATPase